MTTSQGSIHSVTISHSYCGSHDKNSIAPTKNLPQEVIDRPLCELPTALLHLSAVSDINDASTNTGQPVPAEELQKLGVQLSQVGTGLQALEQAKSEAQQSVYPNADGVKLDAESSSEDQFEVNLSILPMRRWLTKSTGFPWKLVETVATQSTVLTHQLPFLWHSYSEDIFLDIKQIR
ncbi:hypothetical protein PM082_008016 [Marasmius tenuissimus]|nr:hypothetical protein PM082_008016 [Marasmius tenuissimus]